MAKTFEPKEKYLNLSRFRLHYLDWGNRGRQPLLLLHGFMAHAHVWDDFARSFRGRYHVVALDQRGHGDTEWSQNGAYSIYDHFSDIVQFVETMGLRDFILMGHSMGGRNALFYAACHPETVRRLILIDARTGYDLKSSKALKNLIQQIPLQAGSLGEVTNRLRILSPYLSERICHHIVIHGFRQMARGVVKPKFDVGMIQQLGELDCDVEDLWPFLQNIECRTLVIRGKSSPFLPKKVAQKICRSIANASLIEIPESTHFPVQENPIVFNRVVSDFLNE